MAYTKPRPNIDYDSKPFWDGLKNNRFLLLRCKNCNEWYWPAAFCRHCDPAPFLSGMDWQDASGKGTIFAFNIHHIAFDPSFTDELPYVYAMIELDEGPMFGTNVVGCKPEEVSIGKRVEIIFEEHAEEGFTLPKARLLIQNASS
jgi:uncharacterized OB-fold protein